jgi:hypothetical protein
MYCQAPGCEKDLNWFRLKLLNRPGFYLEAGWFCSMECLGIGILQRIKKLTWTPEKTVQNLLRIKLGHILLENGTITGEQLEQGMAQQHAHSDIKLGQCLLAMGLVKERDITMALSRQYGLPVIHVNSERIDAAVLKMIPPPILMDAKFVPIEYDEVNNTLLLVTSDPSDISVIINLRSLLNCEASIYLSDETVVTQRIVHFCELASKADIQFREVSLPGNNQEAEPLALFLARQCEELEARSLNFRFFGQRIWARFMVDNSPVDLIINTAAT